MARRATAGKRAAHEGTKALAFQEPWATLIATGVKTHEYRSRDIKTPVKDMVVCASKTPRDYEPIPGLCYGKAIALVDVRSTREYLGGWVWFLENPRLIRPFEVHASASFFYVQDKIEVIPNDRETYDEIILPHAQQGDPDEASYFLDACFGDREALVYAFGDDVEEWL